MTAHRITTVTQEGMAARQPGTNVGTTSPAYDWKTGKKIGGAVLSVSRYYPDLKNEFGGRGVFKKCDCDGMVFDSSEAAFEFAHERGYTRDYYSETPRAQAFRAARIDRRLEHSRRGRQAITGNTPALLTKNSPSC